MIQTDILVIVSTLSLQVSAVLGAAFSGMSIGISLTNILYILLINFSVRNDLAILKTELNSLAEVNETETDYVVGCLTEDSFKTWKKMMPLRGIGRLRLGPQKMTFQTRYLFWSNLELPLNPDEIKIEWIGRVWHNGFVPWFSLEIQGRKMYLTADLGKSLLNALGSEMVTPNVYEKIRTTISTAEKGIQTH